MKYILLPDTQELDGGKKAASLLSLRELGLLVPEWRVVHPRGFYQSIERDHRKQLAKIAAKHRSGTFTNDDQLAMESILAAIVLSEPVRQEIESALGELENAGSFAVRSSGREEDGSSLSFAGQFQSFLKVPAPQVCDRVLDVFKSGFSRRIADYRSHTKGHVTLLPDVPSVIIQEMVDADHAGVAFSSCPVTGANDVTPVEIVKGNGEALVSGEAEGNRWILGKNGSIGIDYHVSGSGAQGSETPMDVLEQEQALALQVAMEARRIAHAAGSPQDIEWCEKSGRIYFLQARPITTLKANSPASSGNTRFQSELIYFDSSNISESYPGVTTPLTFSFAAKAYEHVYRQFLLLCGVSREEIREKAAVFPRMLGLVQGRMYYNLKSWYELLALLPGFKNTSSFMETMMGLSEPVPERIKRSTGKAKPGLAMVKAGIGLILEFFKLDQTARNFSARVDRALAAHGKTLDRMSLSELAAHYRELEGKLLSAWDAPLINDFFAMIFYGVLGRLCRLWLPQAQSLENSLVSGTGGIISSEPARLIREMGLLAASNESLIRCFESGNAEEAIEFITKDPRLGPAFKEYVEKFGDRCFEELKLESPTLEDDPTVLFRSISSAARAAGEPSDKENPFGIDLAAGTREITSLSGSGLSPLQHLVLSRVHEVTRTLIRRRENLRFTRTLVFGRVRKIFKEIGKRFEELKVLDSKNDVFFLEVNEVLGFIEGTSSVRSLSEIASARKEEFKKWNDLPEPATRVAVSPENWTSSSVFAVSQAAEPQKRHPEAHRGVVPKDLSGTPCSPGTVRGRARVVTDPRACVVEKSDILVARRTDPGWVLLFATAGGLVVENGSLLSHSAIVSRELGLPSIVGVKGATSTIKDGDLIEIDGRTGRIFIIAPAETYRRRAS